MYRVLAYEPIDPTGESLKWLGSQGVQLVTGPPMWQSPYQPLDERELIELAYWRCLGRGPHAGRGPLPISGPAGQTVQRSSGRQPGALKSPVL